MASRSRATILEAEVIPYLALSLQEPLRSLPNVIKETVLEIRLRLDRATRLVCADKDLILPGTGLLSRKEMEQTVQFITRSSVYACEEELRQGFITLPGGHRVGLVGQVVMEQGQIRTIKYISSLNIRLAKQVIGAADFVLPYLVQKGGFISTLIVSPPGCGKTTLLRDLIRQLSNGSPGLKLKGHKIGIVDERSEIAACFHGLPQNDIGPRTDVLAGASKVEGIMLLLRSMSPEIIATDEVGSAGDITILEEALVSGVRLVATSHGECIDDLLMRPVLRELIERRLFGRLVYLGLSQGVGTVEAVYNGCDLQPVFLRRPSMEGSKHGDEADG
ncbi:MAG TPA: stage III sporulation protein AA [bacterium]|nr:stage III sporulation protein AA [bacterium]